MNLQEIHDFLYDSTRLTFAKAKQTVEDVRDELGLNIKLDDLSHSVKEKRIDGIVKAEPPYNKLKTVVVGRSIPVKVAK